MKSIYKNIIFIVIASIALVSCESFLDDKSFSIITVDLENEAEAELALTGVYDVLNAADIQGTGNHPLWGRGMHYLTILGTDEAIGHLNSITDPHHRVMANYSYNSESEFVSHAWFALYVGINRCNNIIIKVPSIDMDAERRTQIIAEAHYFRGFYLTYLAWLFGGVPVPLEISSDPKAPRLPLDEVYAQIESDLDYAYNTLDERNIKTGRVDKYTAGTMLAKVYLYLASCKENNVGSTLNISLNKFDWVNESEYYTKAEAVCKDVYDNSQYILHTNYNYLFMADTEVMKTEQRNEVMMAVHTGTGSSSNEYFLFAYLTGPQGNISTNGGNYGWLRGMGELAERYVAQYDLRGIQNISGNVGTATQTIKGVRYYAANAVNTSGDNYCIGKFRQSDPSSRSAEGVPTWGSTLNFPILRFGDVVLMYAEAAFKNGNETLARELLAEIRLRAAGNNAAGADILTTSYYNADFMEELFHERSRELCAEGWRRFDLIRWGKLESVVNATKISNENNVSPNYYYWNTLFAGDVKSNFRDYKIWYPIPKRELELNESLIPNPGYAAE